MKTIRAFIAVELPEAVKTTLAALGRELDGRVPPGSVRWVRPEAMHLTLRFLGDTPQEALPGIQAALDGIGLRHAPFTLELGRVGCFPNCRRPRVVWVGLAGPDADRQALLALKGDIDEGLRPLGWPPEDRPFQAHLTLGRVKDAAGLDRVNWAVEVPALTAPVRAVYLIESRLRPEGPLYTVRHMATLQKGLPGGRQAGD